MTLADAFWNVIEPVIGDAVPNLPAGASPDSMRAVEERFGASLPDTLKRLLFRHDGSDTFFIDAGERHYYLMSTAWMIAVADQKQDALHPSISHKTVGPVSSLNWSSSWLPIATNTDGDYLLIDFLPPENEMTGQLFWRDHEGVNQWVAENIDNWLESVTHNIKSSKYTVAHDEYA